MCHLGIWCYMSYSLNSLKGHYIGDDIGDYYRGYYRGYEDYGSYSGSLHEGSAVVRSRVLR